MKKLPTFYYWQHFNEFLSYFDEQRQSLPQDLLDFIDGYYQLPYPQQCIIARLSQKKYTVFCRNKLDYPEITDFTGNLTRLIQSGWIIPVNLDSLYDVIGGLNKKDIESLFIQCRKKPSSSYSKKQLACWVDQFKREKQFSMPEQEEILQWAFAEQLRSLFLISFGTLENPFYRFVMRDLGLSKVGSFESSSGIRFNHHNDVVLAYYFAKLLLELSQTPHEILSKQVLKLPHSMHLDINRLKDRYLFELGKKLMATNELFAFHCLSRSNKFQALELWTKEKIKRNQFKEVNCRFVQLINITQDRKLTLFIQDIQNRYFSKKPLSLAQERMRQCDLLVELPVCYKNRIETGVIDYFHKTNRRAWFTENHLWKSLFALTFWPILFKKRYFFHPFQRLPQCLRNNSFYTLESRNIEKICTLLSTKLTAKKWIRKQFEKHYGQSNGIFSWSDDLIDLLDILLENSPSQSIMTLLRLMAKDFKNLTVGFPDLMIQEQDRLVFIEVKGPSDSLRFNQLFTQNQLIEIGFNIDILKVKWQKMQHT